MLVDSNILVYAINKASPKHKTAILFLKENNEKLEIAHQNIFETLRVLTHSKFPNRMKYSLAVKAVLAIVQSFNIVSPNTQTLYIALELIKKYKISSDVIFDAYLAATMLTNYITTIATDNVKDFKKFTEIEVFNPFSE